MNRPRFDLEGDPRPCWIDRALEQAALVHWPQVTFAGLLGFALGLLAWGCV